MAYVGGSSKSSAIPWLTLYPITQHYTGPNGETGIDVGTPFHTPISFPVGGKVLGAGYYGGGGVVSIGFDLGGKPAAMYVQHLDTIEPGIAPGVALAPGQIVGLSGGQLSGGSHPSSRQFSSGPHTEIGVNAPYGGMWNPYGYGPNFDPIPVLQELLAGLPATTSGVLAQVQGTVAATSVKTTTAPGFGPIAQSLHDIQAIVPIDPLAPGQSLAHDAAAVASRAIVAGIGLLIIGAVLVRAAAIAAGEGAQKAEQVVGLVGAAGGI